MTGATGSASTAVRSDQVSYVPKIRIDPLGIRNDYHRGGWNYAEACLRPLETPSGILFEGLLELHLARGARRADLGWPRREPWIGFLHNPHNMPQGHFDGLNPRVFMRSPIWIESMKTCRGLFALSKYYADWLRRELPVAIGTLLHPTETPLEKFDWERFASNPRPRVVHVGRWLRRFESILELQASGFTKTIVSSPGASFGDLWKSKAAGDVELMDYLSPPDYDRVLAENIAFSDLLDASANNLVVECIVRGTPLVVNRHPAVVEYMGADYPLLYDSVEEAGRLIGDRARLAAAHHHLVARNKGEPFSGEAFRDAFATSDIYSRL